MIVVFDFDKTLTYKDTLFDFFRFVAKNRKGFVFKVPLYFISMIFTKLKLISNTKLKEIGINLFLKGLSKKKLKEISNQYAKTIKLNKLYYSTNFKDNNYFIVSASFEEYLKPLFPTSTTILASSLIYKEGKVETLKFNCYKQNKLQALKALNITNIDKLYTDSISDLPLAKISSKIYLINDDSIRVCKSINEFINNLKVS